jgi:AraC-like DNA-binding protein
VLQQPISAADTPGTDDDLVAQLLGEALALFDRDRDKARRRIEHAFALSRTRNGNKLIENKLIENGGMLAGWQLRRSVSYIENNLGTSLRIEEVANLVNLSASYFSRAFKASVGVCYSEFVAQARLTLAKRLLLTTKLPIAEITLTCGFSDQPHFTRVFGRAVGMPPYTWRRQLVNAVHEQKGAYPQTEKRRPRRRAIVKSSERKTAVRSNVEDFLFAERTANSPHASSLLPSPACDFGGGYPFKREPVAGSFVDKPS